MTRLLLALALFAATLTGSQAAAANPAVITVGTSIEYGTGLNPGESWPQRLALRAPGYSFSDMSLPGGDYTADNSLGDNIRKHVDQAIAQHPDMIILGGPVNDLVRLSDVGPLRQAVFDAGNAVIAAGISLKVMAIFPFTDGAGDAFQAGWWPNLESRRQTYNSWAEAMYGSNCIGVDWALHETTSQRGDARWFSDGLHLDRVGARLTAEAFPVERLG